MKVGGLFSGIGGFELGLVRAGFEIAWMVEIDPFCQKVLRKHAPTYWPNAEIFGDIKDVGKHNLEPVDLICGGFPCQPHSLAGKRRGAADDRDLWPEYHRVIAELRPTWVIGENVPGIFGVFFDSLLSDMANLGYETSTFIIPACAVNAPHRRDRVFIVAHTNSKQAHQQRSRPIESSGQQGESLGTRKEATRQKNRETSNNHPTRFREVLAYTNSSNGNGRPSDVQMGRFRSKEEVKKDGDARRIEWQSEPSICRVANGIPYRLDRLRSLGNALLPQIPEILGRMIQEIESGNDSPGS